MSVLSARSGRWLLFAVVAGSCVGEGTPTYRADDRHIQVAVGDEFVIDLADDPDDSLDWVVAIDPAYLGSVDRRFTAMPGVRQVESGYLSAGGRWSEGSMEVYLATPSTRDDHEVVGDALRADPAVQTITYVSQEEQFELFTEYFADEPEYLANVVAQDLPASFRVALKPHGLRLVGEEARQDRTQFRFEALAAGTLDLEFIYVEPDINTDDHDTRTFRVTVR